MPTNFSYLHCGLILLLAGRTILRTRLSSGGVAGRAPTVLCQSESELRTIRAELPSRRSSAQRRRHFCRLPPPTLNFARLSDHVHVNIREMYPLRNEIVKGPSVEYMYQSLVHIVSNHPHWTFMDLFGSWPAMLNCTPKLIEAWEMNYVVFGLFLLSFDLSDAADDVAAEFKEIASWNLMQLNPSPTRPMAAMRLIEIYYISGKSNEKGAELRSQIIAKSFGILKDGYHKKQELDMATLTKYRMST